MVASLVGSVVLQNTGGPQPDVFAKPGQLETLYARAGDLSYASGPQGDDLARFLNNTPATANITVTYTSISGEARAAFQTAVDIWARTIASPAPIRIAAIRQPMADGVLASGGPTLVCYPRAGGMSDTWYAAALADRLNGTPYCAANLAAEIVVNITAAANWDFGIGGTGAAGKYNLMTVALHEIAHGLGIGGAFSSAGGIANLGQPLPHIYDRFSVTGAGATLLGIVRPSAALHAQLTSDDTFFGGARAAARNGGIRPKLESHHMTNAFGVPSDQGWLADSSYVHVDDVLYSGTPNGLMTWALNTNEVYTDVGPALKGILEELGWTTAADVPGRPVLVSPYGLAGTTTPDFIWMPVSGATTYDLYVQEADPSLRTVINRTYQAASICSSDRCTQPAPVSLSNAQRYDWWVRASNGFGSGPWSIPFAFVTNTAVATVLAPTGSNTSMWPEYLWERAGDASWYGLKVERADDGSTVLERWYVAPGSCRATISSATPPTVLAPNTAYRTTVTAWFQHGLSTVSAAVPFTTGITPTPTPIGPSGNTDSPAPTYSWKANGPATYYHLYVQRSGDDPIIQETYAASTVCAEFVCKVTPRTELADGIYAWWVRGQYPTATGNWSVEGRFIVSAGVPRQAVPRWPLEGEGGATVPAYRWDKVNEATWYYLWVRPTAGGPPVIESWLFSADVCGEHSCVVRPRVPLTPGASYSWWVRAWSSRGYAPWSAATSFSVPTMAPGAATPLGPTGAGVSAIPTYTWTRVATSGWYLVQVTRADDPTPSGIVLYRWYPADEVCDSSTCSVGSAVALTGGAGYRMQIQTYNELGYGPWSTALSFSR